MPGVNDPSLLLFAGNLLSGTGGGQGFGGSLGNALTGAGQSVLLRQQQDRQRQQDLIGAAESAIGIRAALGELQARQRQQEAEAAYLGGLPEDQRAVAAVNPQQAALNQLPQEITPYQQANLDLAQKQEQRLSAGQEFDQGIAVQQLGLEKAELAAEMAEAQLPEKPKLSDISTFRKQYLSESKDFGDVIAGYKNVLSSSFGGESGASDIALLFGYMKMLDPGSVVREGEFDRVKLAAGPAAHLMNTWDFVKSGQLLGQTVRDDIRDRAGDFYGNAASTQRAKATGFANIAKRHNIDQRDILEAVPIPEGGVLKMDAVRQRLSPLGLTMDDVEETAAKRGMSVDDVLADLGVSGG